MQRNMRHLVSHFATLAAIVMAGQAAVAADAPLSREVQNMVDFQCHGATTLKQAEANYANLARGYTDAHPAMACLKKKIEALRATGK
jgi:hypothetical protein